MVELHAKIIGCVLRQCRADCADRRRHGVDRIDRALGQQCAACLEIETELELRVDGIEEGIEFLVEIRRQATQRFGRSEEHTSELQSLMRISYAVFCLKKKNRTYYTTHNNLH